MADQEPENPSTPPLLVWALAAFHAALLVAVAVAGLYAAGVAGDALAGLDTAVGAAAYLYLWAVTWWTNRSMLHGLEIDLLTGEPWMGDLGSMAAKWGAIAGVSVFLPVLLLGVVVLVGAGGLEALPFLAVGGAIGALLAAGLGVLVGVAFAAIDLTLIRAVRAWLPAQGGHSGEVHTR